MTEFLDWLARAVGVTGALVAIVGYMFREKWKQVLQRSLATDLERLKGQLSKESAEHAASLTPQIELIKHDFQQKIEAYKVSLIAQTEALKAQQELRKSLALRYSEIEFERLIALELQLARIGPRTLAAGCIDPSTKTLDQQRQAVEDISELGVVSAQAEMFISQPELMAIIEFRQKLFAFVEQFVGPNKPTPPDQYPLELELQQLAASTHVSVKNRIKALGTLD
jgi:hypothetical protein